MTPDMHLRTVWQLSAGSTDRSYSNVLIQYGVGLVGSGDSGPWQSGRQDDEFDGRFVRVLAGEVKINDIVLLRSGINTILAIGVVASDYLYLDQFDDVNGWDLQHARRIRWYKLPQANTFSSQVFGANPPRLSRCQNKEIVDYAKRFVNSSPSDWQFSILPELPNEEAEWSDIPIELQTVVSQAHDLTPLFEDRVIFGDPPSENELIAHFVVPFLQALGWPAEYIAVEWRNIDVAVFKALPRTTENCKFIIEAKRLGSGIEGALDQGKRYVKALRKPLDIVVTDGIRYRMYSCEKDFKPVAYANFTRLKKSAINFIQRIKKQ